MTNSISNLLVVGDGLEHFGISFAPTQDATNCTFTMSEFLYLVSSHPQVRIRVDTASRNNDPNAKLKGFIFGDDALVSYDVLWLAGYEGKDDDNEDFMSVAPLSADEIAAIWRFMQRGGGVFATGDHAGLGSSMCGNIPRVRSMRKWFSSQVECPADCQQGVNVLGQVVQMENWGGALASSNSHKPRIDTLQHNASDVVAGEFDFDNQSDAVPQAIFVRSPHPIFTGRGGTITRFPDHMHEGEVVTPYKPGMVNVAGASQAEYPSSASGQPLPLIIATMSMVPGHSTVVTNELTGPCSFHGDSAPTEAGTFGLVCAYDGRAAAVGRIVTDSSFHHFLDLNLVGNPLAGTPDRRGGFGQKYVPPEPGSVLADMQDYYANVVQWLSPPRKGLAACHQFGISNQTDVFTVDDGGNLTVTWGDGSPGWGGPAEIGVGGTLVPGGFVAASQRFGNPNRTDVFSVDISGHIVVASVIQSGPWKGTGIINGPDSPLLGSFVPGSYLAVSNQFGVPGQTDVFAVNGSGQLTVSWAGQNDDWSSRLLMAPVFGGVPHIGEPAEPVLLPPGAPLAASARFGVVNQTDVYGFDSSGSLKVVSVVGSNLWQRPQAITPKSGVFPSAAPLAVSNRFGVADQTDVFAVDLQGALSVFSVRGTGQWSAQAPISGQGVFPPRAHVAASNRFGVPNQTDVFAVNNDGALTVASVLGLGPWTGPTAISPAGMFQPGTAVAACNQFGTANRTDVFALNKLGQAVLSFVIGNGQWSGPSHLWG